MYGDAARQYEAKRSSGDRDAAGSDPAPLFQTRSCRGIRDGHSR